MGDFASNLAMLRDVEGYSQTELAKLIDVSQPLIGYWEQGKSQPTAENILALAHAFSISTDELLGNEELGDYRPLNTPTLSDDERLLLAMFKSLPSASRFKILGYVEGELDTYKGIAEQNRKSKQQHSMKADITQAKKSFKKTL